MKHVLIAAAATAVLAAPAVAQTAQASESACPAIGAAPVVPDGASAEREAMVAANEAYQTWATATRDTLNCRRAEIETLRARERALTDVYQAGVAQLESVTTSIVAEAEEFNAR